MKYKFNDIDNKLMYDSARVVFIAGPYNIFNNVVIDRIRTECKGELAMEEDSDLVKEFTISSNSEEVQAMSFIDFSTFMDVVRSPAITGKWYCSVDYKMLTKKQKETLERYYKKPSENGVLVVSMAEYTDYKRYINNRVLRDSTMSHIIQLSFPNKHKLGEIVTKRFEEKGVKVAPKAIDLFIMRMSSSYDEYDKVIDNICYENEGGMIQYSDMVGYLKGIENFVLDDFLYLLTAVIRKDKIVTSRKVYKAESAMIADMGVKKLISRLKYKVSDLIEMRILINSGIVPIRVRYSVEESKRRMDPEHLLHKLSEYSFRKLASLASMTSLKDWVYIKIMLDKVDGRSPEWECEQVLHAIINRSILGDSRIKNNIGVSNIIEEQLFELNKLQYQREEWMESL